MEIAYGIIGLVLGAAAGAFYIQKKLQFTIQGLQTELTGKDSDLRLKDVELGNLKVFLTECREELQGERDKLQNEAKKAIELNITNITYQKTNDDLTSKLKILEEKQESVLKANIKLETDLSSSLEKIKGLEEFKATATQEAQKKYKETQDKIDGLINDKSKLEKELTAINEQEPIRQQDYGQRIKSLTDAIVAKNLEEEKIKEQYAQAEALRLQILKETWARHEAEVEAKIRAICQQESIEYVEKAKFPLTGKPDNAIKICDEYIIFDSKSPQGEDLSNFPSYLKIQADAAKKYAKHDEVKRDVFFVIPTTAISSIPDTFIHLGNHRLHIITIDSLRPILLQLKAIENYEFAEQLSPEDREQTVSVIGRLVHGVKRRVQINQFLDNDAIATLMEAEKLPTQILMEVQKVEKGTKIKVPQGARGKKIEIESIETEHKKLVGKVLGQDIHSGPELKTIDSIPLYKSESDEN